MKRLIIAKIVLLTLVTVCFAANVWGKTVTLSWDPSPSEVSGYKIYYDTGSSAAPLDGTGATEGSSPIDVGNVLTFTVNGLPDAEEHYFAVTAYDAENHESTYSNTVTSPVVGGENSPPILSAIGNKSILESATLNFTVSATDADGETLTYSAGGLPTGASFNSSTRAFSWTPASNQSGSYSVTFTVNDGSASDAETINITVTNVNQPPVLDPIGAQSLAEGDSYNLIISASDPDNNPLTYSASNLPSGAVFIPSTRSFSWIPGNDQAGTYQVLFSTSDGSLSDSENVTFTVGNGNEAPVLTSIGSQTIGESSLLSFVITASDVNGDSLSYSTSGLPTGAVFAADQQRFSWTPDYTQAGNFTVLFTVTDGLFSDSESIAITVTNSNRPPVISGTPGDSVMATASYSFTPVASDPDGDAITFSITNKPNWATFSTATGELSGTPSEAQVGINSNIVISVNDSNSSVSLSSFTIDVIAYANQDSDGDGVLDHLDAFPNDINEWVDTDGDEIGNNADLDDDNDGIADVRDGFPLDATQSGWVVSATAGAGGYITPEGETSILYGGSQHYQLTPMAGYYVDDLLVDNLSVGLVADYVFDNVSAHHSIVAIFAPIPTGLSHDPTAAGLSGIERVDGGDDGTNLVDSKPKQDLDFRFRVVLRDSAAVDQRKVFLVLDGYKYEMQLEGGALASGADYIYTTRLGASATHRFNFKAEDLSDNQVWRYPESGDLPGPVVELLNGKNVVGVAANINGYALNATEVFSDNQVYRWLPAAGASGQFALTDSGAPIASAEGYVLKRGSSATLGDLSLYPQISDPVHEFQIQPGWNLISNPYGGNVSLAAVEVRLGTAAPVSWLTAATNNLLVDALYSYLGTDWGNRNEFTSAAGTHAAVLVPWIGYWIYVNPTEQDISLLISKPLQ